MTSERKPHPPAEAENSLRNIKEMESGALLGPAGEVRIRHEGRVYRLRRTRQGKLILTA